MTLYFAVCNVGDESGPVPSKITRMGWLMHGISIAHPSQHEQAVLRRVRSKWLQLRCWQRAFRRRAQLLRRTLRWARRAAIPLVAKRAARIGKLAVTLLPKVLTKADRESGRINSTHQAALAGMRAVHASSPAACEEVLHGQQCVLGLDVFGLALDRVRQTSRRVCQASLPHLVAERR